MGFTWGQLWILVHVYWSIRILIQLSPHAVTLCYAQLSMCKTMRMITIDTSSVSTSNSLGMNRLSYSVSVCLCVQNLELDTGTGLAVGNTPKDIMKSSSQLVLVGAVISALYFSAQFPMAVDCNGEEHIGLGTSLQCALCELAVKEVLAYAELNKTEEKILDDLKADCPKFFNLTLLDECNQFFDEYGRTVLRLVIQEVDPAKVCDHVIGHNETCTDNWAHWVLVWHGKGNANSLSVRLPKDALSTWQGLDFFLNPIEGAAICLESGFLQICAWLATSICTVGVVSGILQKIILISWIYSLIFQETPSTWYNLNMY